MFLLAGRGPGGLRRLCASEGGQGEDGEKRGDAKQDHSILFVPVELPVGRLFAADFPADLPDRQEGGQLLYIAGKFALHKGIAEQHRKHGAEDVHDAENIRQSGRIVIQMAEGGAQADAVVKDDAFVDKDR